MRTTGTCRPVAVAGAVALLALLAAGETAAQGPNQGPVFTAGSCSYSLSSDSEDFYAAGGTGTFSASWTWTAPPPGICTINCTAQACGSTTGAASLQTWITIDNWQANTATSTTIATVPLPAALAGSTVIQAASVAAEIGAPGVFGQSHVLRLCAAPVVPGARHPARRCRTSRPLV